MSFVHLRQALSRRTLLRGAAGIGIGLPLLQAMEARGQTVTAPKRLVIVFTGNGTQQANWGPPAGSNPTETSWQLGEVLSPLAAHKSKLLVLERLDMESAHHGPGDGHQKGMAHLLTGTEIQSGTLFTGGNGEGTGWGGGISVDQVVANRIGNAVPFGSLLFGVKVPSNNIWSRMSYSAPGVPLSPENSPLAMFDRVFAPLSQSSEEQARIRTRRLSILDYVRGDFEALNGKLGAADRAKLDAHLTTIRDIERRLNAEATEPGAACVKPTRAATYDFMADANYPKTGGLQMDLLAMALACDLTRVATIQWSKSVSQATFPFIGITDRHHDLSHNGDTDTVTQDKLTKINKWYAGQFAGLLDRMNGITEGEKTLLDNSVVVWGNELGKGNSHTRRDVPFVLAGSCGGYFRTGRYLNMNGAWHNDLWVSVLNAMGYTDTKFGNPAYCKAKLTQLT